MAATVNRRLLPVLRVFAPRLLAMQLTLGRYSWEGRKTVSSRKAQPAAGFTSRTNDMPSVPLNHPRGECQ